MAINGNIPVKRSKLPYGDAGVDQTVRTMAKMAFGPYGAKSAKVRAKAIDIITAARIPEKDYYGEAVALFDWVRDNIRYVKDPVGQETLSYAEETLFNSRSGDCDDQVIALMALLGAIGIRSYPVVVGVQKNAPYSHVYMHAIIPPGPHRMAGSIIPMDPIMRWPAGREAAAPRVQRKKEYPQHSGIEGIGNMSNNMLPGMGAYAVGPSYLDTEDAHVSELLAEGSPGGTTRVAMSKNALVSRDGNLATTTKSIQPEAGADSMFTRGTKVRTTPTSTGAAVVARQDRYGRVWNNSVQPRPAGKVGPEGPLVQHGAAQVTHLLQSERAKEVPTASGAMRVESRGMNRKKRVTIQGGNNGRRMMTAQDHAEDIQGIGEYAYALAGAVGCCGCEGLGYVFDGGPDDAVEETALLSWYADMKSDMLDAIEKVANKYARHARSPQAKVEAMQAKKMAKNAKQVAKNAKQVACATAKTANEQAVSEGIKAKMTQDNAVSGFGNELAGMGVPMETKIDRMKRRLHKIGKPRPLRRAPPQVMYQGSVRNVQRAGHRNLDGDLSAQVITKEEIPYGDGCKVVITYSDASKTKAIGAASYNKEGEKIGEFPALVVGTMDPKQLAKMAKSAIDTGVPQKKPGQDPIKPSQPAPSPQNGNGNEAEKGISLKTLLVPAAIITGAVLLTRN